MRRRPDLHAALLLALVAFACDAKKAPPKARPPEPEARAPEPAHPAPTGLCADFAACRDACDQRKRGACVRMQRRAADAERAEAEKLATRLCDAGYPEACHVRSTQLKSDRARAGKALTRACELGYGPSCAALAATTKDRKKADELRGRAAASLERLCRDEDTEACTALARAARFPPEGDQPDLSRSRWHYDRACDLGDETACFELVEQLNGQYPDLERALLDRACELGEPRACAKLGR